MRCLFFDTFIFALHAPIHILPFPNWYTQVGWFTPYFEPLRVQGKAAFQQLEQLFSQRVISYCESQQSSKHDASTCHETNTHHWAWTGMDIRYINALPDWRNVLAGTTILKEALWTTICNDQPSSNLLNQRLSSFDIYCASIEYQRRSS